MQMSELINFCPIPWCLCARVCGCVCTLEWNACYDLQCFCAQAVVQLCSAECLLSQEAASQPLPWYRHWPPACLTPLPPQTFVPWCSINTETSWAGLPQVVRSQCNLFSTTAQRRLLYLSYINLILGHILFFLHTVVFTRSPMTLFEPRGIQEETNTSISWPRSSKHKQLQRLHRR